MSKLPAIQFYPGDWKRDAGVQSLSFEERGVWFELLLLMFESCERGKLIFPNGTPMPEDAVARALGLDKQKYNQIISKLLEYGIASKEEESGIIYSRRMVRDAEISKLRAEAGKLGGNPNLLNQNPSKPSSKGEAKRKQKSTPSSSSSSSNKEKDKKEKSDEADEANKSPVSDFLKLLPENFQTDEFRKAWADWLDYRRERRLPRWVGATLKLKAKEFADLGLERVLAAIRHSISNGFQGIYEQKGVAQVPKAAGTDLRSDPGIDLVALKMAYKWKNNLYDSQTNQTDEQLKVLKSEDIAEFFRRVGDSDADRIVEALADPLSAVSKFIKTKKGK